MYEGQRVTYVGQPEEGLLPGETGRLLIMASSTAAHVQMPSGGIYLVMTDDLVPVTGKKAAAPAPDLLEDSLEVGTLPSFSASLVDEETDETELLNKMASAGMLSAFSDIAEEALMMISSRIRQDPVFREVLAGMDESEGESLVRLASTCLIRDAFGDGEE
jgi:hypothetical protein